MIDRYSTMYYGILWTPIDLENPPVPDRKILDGITDLLEDDYRDCKHIPLMIKTGQYHDYDKYIYHSNITLMPDLKEWIDNILIPFLGHKSRMVIIKTPKDAENKIHIDCTEDAMDLLQHKIRYVMHGKVSDLEFIGENCNIKPAEIDAPFIMDGSWPHKMKNTSGDTKYTFAVGSPWQPEMTKEYQSFLKRSANKYKCRYIDKAGIDLPSLEQRRKWWKGFK